jgi:hypothetical protein
MVVKMPVVVIWVVMMCALIGGYKHFRGTYCLHLQDDNHFQDHMTSQSRRPQNGNSLYNLRGKRDIIVMVFEVEVSKCTHLLTSTSNTTTKEMYSHTA